MKKPPVFKSPLEGFSDLAPSMPSLPSFEHAYHFPEIEIPSLEESHDYESSALLLERLAARIRGPWRQKLPEDAQPVVVALLPNTGTVRVVDLAEEGHNGVAIKGKIGDSDTECLLLVHQNNLQLLCFIEKVVEKKKRYRIGFSIEGERNLVGN